AERLIPMLEEVLADVGAAWEELDAIGVGVGPGNFTGVRIAVSAARGLAMGLGVPAVGVTAFEALRRGAPQPLPSPLIVSLPVARPHADVMLQYFEGTAAIGGPVEVKIHVTNEAAPAFSGFPNLAHVLGHEAFAVNWVVNGGKAEATHLEFGPAFGLVDQIARDAADRIASGEHIPRPAPLYIRPADAAPPSDPPPKIIA
ncbi:MAG: tRNA (adenosine(37)-N6)-threonylcarbamoyltransferase complex dimerization subunit type 1 TsaB, partial [Pseudomonadota bacterium]